MTTDPTPTPALLRFSEAEIDQFAILATHALLRHVTTTMPDQHEHSLRVAAPAIAEAAARCVVERLVERAQQHESSTTVSYETNWSDVARWLHDQLDGSDDQ